MLRHDRINFNFCVWSDSMMNIISNTGLEMLPFGLFVIKNVICLHKKGHCKWVVGFSKIWLWIFFSKVTAWRYGVTSSKNFFILFCFQPNVHHTLTNWLEGIQGTMTTKQQSCIYNIWHCKPRKIMLNRKNKMWNIQ